MKNYALWEIRTNNLIRDFNNERDAFAATVRFIEINGQATAEYLALTVEDEQGDGKLIASGQELAVLAQRRLAEHQVVG